MALGWGIQEWGLDYWGSVGPLDDTGFGDFQFQVLAMSQGYTIRITLTTPEPIDSPRWSRRFLILRKRAEWPQSVDDVDVEVISDVVEPAGDVEYKYFDEDLISGENYYYRLFLLGTDGLWYSSRAEMDSAYPYSRWGCARSMYMSLPRGWRSHDITADLRNTIEMYGALADNLKTDFEYLRTLFSISEVHEDLIPIADSKIGWPTWLQAGGIHRRQDSESAVETYKRLGTEFGYAQLIETVTDWELTITQGWKYIMWSNTEYCTTPDLSDPEIKKDLNGPEDKLRYVNDASRWQSFTGLGFYLTEIPGVTGPFTQDMWDRILFLIKWGKACYVVYQVRVVPVVDEYYPADGIIDEAPFPLIAFIERSVNSELDEDETSSADLAMFMSTNPNSLSNDNEDRTHHGYLGFDEPAEYNLLEDGNMEYPDTSAWVLLSGVIATKESGQRPGSAGELILRTEIPLGDTYAGVRQDILETGRKYNIRGWAKDDGVNSIVGIGNLTGNDIASFVAPSWTYFDYGFEAAGQNVYVGATGNVATVDYADFDDVYVTEAVLGGSSFIGNDGANEVDGSPLRHYLTRYLAGTSGTTATFVLFSARQTEGYAKVNVYSDSGGDPSTLLASVGIPVRVTPGWNEISLSVTLASGTYYWLGVITDQGKEANWAPGTATTYYRAIPSFEGFDAPSTIDVGDYIAYTRPLGAHLRG